MSRMSVWLTGFPLVVRTPLSAHHFTSDRIDPPDRISSVQKRSASASSGTARIMSSSGTSTSSPVFRSVFVRISPVGTPQPNGRIPPIHSPFSAFCRRARATRSPLCSDSWRATAPRIRAVIRPDGVARSTVPAWTVWVAMPRRSDSSMYSSSSTIERVSRSVCQTMTTVALPWSRSASMRR